MGSLLTGLLVGAGASCEVGMPLTWEVTAELKDWLTSGERQKQLNRVLRSQGHDDADQVVSELASVLARPEMHYESILGYLETQARRRNIGSSGYHHVRGLLEEAVYHILHLRHVRNVQFIEQNLRHLVGLKQLVAENNPLWVFSLNHDVIIECAAAHYGLPLCSGFGDQRMVLPRRNRKGKVIGELHASVLSEEQLKSGMPFLQPGSHGINLLKIHGALDVFTVNDGRDTLKLLPTTTTAQGVLDALATANEDLRDMLPDSVRPINEIAFADAQGVTQFMRRTLLATVFKFDPRHPQVLPSRFLDFFRWHINYVSKLVCVGYGFGDVHINQVVREWLELWADRRLEIVDPFAKCVPGFLLHLTPQITLITKRTSDYLDEVAGVRRTRRELLEKRLAEWARGRGAAGAAEFQAFMAQYARDSMRTFGQQIATLPRRDGDIDLQALGLTATEVTQRLAQKAGISIEDLLEGFLQSRGTLGQQPPTLIPTTEEPH